MDWRVLVVVAAGAGAAAVVVAMMQSSQAEVDPDVFAPWPGPAEAYRGPEHCGWQGVAFMSVYTEDDREDRQYVRDPEGVLHNGVREPLAPFEDDADLPADAVDTGFRNEFYELWLAADREYAYLVRGDDVEGWPQAEPKVVC
jgi:hypothetical protein